MIEKNAMITLKLLRC